MSLLTLYLFVSCHSQNNEQVCSYAIFKDCSLSWENYVIILRQEIVLLIVIKRISCFTRLN